MTPFDLPSPDQLCAECREFLAGLDDIEDGELRERRCPACRVAFRVRVSNGDEAPAPRFAGVLFYALAVFLVGYAAGCLFQRLVAGAP